MFETSLLRPAGPRPLVWALAMGLLCLPLSAGQDSRRAQGAGEIPDWEWPIEVEGPLRTFFEREDVEVLLEGVVRPRTASTSDVAGLAAALGPNIEQVFRHVQRRIRYEPYVGSIRGVAGTLRAGAGNAIDQALLLRELLRVSGHQARLARGRLDWESAVLLTGETRRARPGRGDPWLRQVEAASDHWWVEVRDGGRWVAADPAFAATALGDEMARRRETTAALPTRLVASMRLELTVGGRRLGGLQLPVAEVFGTSVQVLLARPVGEENSDPEGNAERAGQPPAVDPELVVDDRVRVATREVPVDPDPLDPAPVLAASPALPPGPIVLEIRAAGRVIQALPVSRGQLGQVRLDVDIEIPPGRHVRAFLPFGDDPFGRLSVVVAGGEVRSSVYTRQLTSLYDGLDRLATAEAQALEAWNVRPRGGDEEADAFAPANLAVAPLPERSLDGAAEAEPLVHPAVALHVAALRAWEVFADQGLDVIALALLGAADQLRAAVPIQRADIRLVGLHYQPGTLEAEGGITAWISDAARIGGPMAQQRVSTQVALGILQSAVAGQVLNRVADRPPITAYDLTLRAVGSGGRLSWFRRGDSPPNWPPGAIQFAAAEIDAGRTVVGPTRPIRRGDQELLAWWSMDANSGMTAGRVQRPMGVAQAAVAIGPAVDLASLDSILASLHDLHVAMRWLLTLADPDRGVLRGLVPGACAATPLVADLLRAGAPADFVPPAFDAFCQPTGPS